MRSHRPRRFSVSRDADLVSRLDRMVQVTGSASHSQAVAGTARSYLVDHHGQSGTCTKHAKTLVVSFVPGRRGEALIFAVYLRPCMGGERWESDFTTQTFRVGAPPRGGECHEAQWRDSP